MTAPRKALILFLRIPEPGRVKSRLAAAIGPEAAMRVYEKLLRRILGVAADYKRLHPDVKLFVAFTPPEKADWVRRAAPGPWVLIEQEGAHLGERMEKAMAAVRARGFEHVLLTGSDLADLAATDFEEGFAALERGAAPLGPAADGGFYLIGLDRPCPAPFLPEAWGGAEIFERTRRLLSDSGLKVESLQTRVDIDRPEDLACFNRLTPFRETVSVVIPTLSRPRALEPLLHGLEPQLWPEDEILVVQGDGADDQAAYPLNRRIRWLHSPPGRGLQLNRGALAARGSLLFFLHGDSLPPPQFPYLVRKLADSNSAAMGCFHLAFSPSPPPLDWIARWANFRTRVFGLPYGDQGYFCRRTDFDRLGGFHNRFLMEDIDFVTRCKQLGSLVFLPEILRTSPERYLAKGILRASLQNHLLMLLYRLGVDERRLYALYYRS